jgi:hypothetical protein
MPGPLAQWRRRGAWLQVGLGLFAVMCLVWGGRKFARGIDRRALIALEEFGCAVAPLILIALVWLLAGSTRPPNPRVRSRKATDAITTPMRT